MVSKETTSKEWWKIARSQLGMGKYKSIDSLIVDNVLISEDTSMCNAFNDFFINEASQLYGSTTVVMATHGLH